MMYDFLRYVFQAKTPNELLNRLSNTPYHDDAAILSLRRYETDARGRPRLAPEAFWKRDDAAVWKDVIYLDDAAALNWIKGGGVPLFIENFDEFSLFSNSATDFYKQQGIRSLYRVLLRRGEQIIAMLSVMWKENRQFSNEYEAHIECLSWVLAPVLEGLYADEEKERLSVTIKEMEKKLDEAEIELHSLAHDLKQPLTAIISTADTLKTYLDRLSKEKTTNMIQRITEASVGMNEWITSVLLLAQMKSSDNLELKPIDMSLSVQQVVDELAELLQNHNADIIYDLSLNRSTLVRGESTWVAHIWANLISNACKYGGASPTITLAADDLGNQIRFTIQDNGQGIPEDKLALVFEPFIRLDEHKPRLSGTGIGLTTVKMLVERLNGKVGVESSTSGSIFWFTLQKAPASVSASAS